MVIQDGTEYIAVWQTTWSLTNLTWWSALGGDISRAVIAKYDSNLNVVKVDNSTWWQYMAVLKNWANYLAVWSTWTNEVTWLSNFLLVLYDSDLNILLSDNFWWGWDDDFRDVIFDGTDFVMVWQTYSDLSVPPFDTLWWITSEPNGNVLIAKFDVSWNPIKIVNNTWWVFYSVIQDGTDYIAVWKRNTGSFYEFIIAKYDSALNMTDFKKYGTNWENAFKDIILDGTN